MADFILLSVRSLFPRLILYRKLEVINQILNLQS